MTNTNTSGPAGMASEMLKVLRRGSSYLAETSDGHAAIGRYLGIEVTYGDRAILIAGEGSTESITIDRLSSLQAQSA